MQTGFKYYACGIEGFPGGSVIKNLPANAGDERDTSMIPGSSRKWQPDPEFLPGQFHGQRKLVGYSPWDHRVGHD